MTRETAKRMIKGHPPKRQETARRDIDERAYEQTCLVPVFEIDGNAYQFTVMYKVRISDGEYVFGRAMSIDEFCSMQAEAARGEQFRIMYLRDSRIIIEIETLNA